LEDREIYKIINEMKKDDILIVTELSRIARSMSEINEITSIAIRKGIIIRVISGDRIIDNSIQSQSLTFAIGMSAQIERDLISERTKSALKEAKNRGVKMGRPKKSGIKLEGREKEIKEMLKNGASKSYIARALSVNRITVDKFIKDNALNEKLIKEMTKNKIKQ
jgi:DNA invertase Pin-like site-specific DNA recombinase